MTMIIVSLNTNVLNLYCPCDCADDIMDGIGVDVNQGCVCVCSAAFEGFEANRRIFTAM